MASFQEIQFQVSENHAEITLNRPERLNAMDYSMIAELNRAIEMTADDPSVRSLVLKGAGRAFCSGDNLKGMGEPPRPPRDLFSKASEVGYITVLRNLRNLHKPVISAVHGYALGAGLDLVLATDIRILRRDAQVGMPFSKLGYAAGTYLLPRAVGTTRAIEMLFSARNLCADEALEYQIATEVVESQADLEASVRRWTELCNKRPTKTLGYMKEAVYRSYENDFESGFELLRLHRVLVETTEDFQEGKSAWREKREPQFRGA
ncbi:MAG TPA: enoyl-CoA hydratase/isomerase family protein [Trueperaceae bacterium]